jgi:hypothetical protein
MHPRLAQFVILVRAISTNDGARGNPENLVLENRDIRAMVESLHRPAVRSQVANGRSLFFGSEGSFSQLPCTSNDEGLR